MSKTAIAATCLVLLYLTGAAEAEGDRRRLTLEEAVALALESNEDIRIAEEEIKSAKEGVTEARAGRLPHLSAGGAYTRNIEVPVTFVPADFIPGGEPGTFIKMKFAAENLYGAQVRFTQPLYVGGKLSAAVASAKLYKLLSEEAYRGTRQQVVFVAKSAFYVVLLSKEALEVNREALGAAERNLENVRRLFESGRVSEFDVIRAEVQVSNLTPTVTESQNNLENAYNNLKRVLGLSLSAEIEAAAELEYSDGEIPSLESLLEEAILSRPELAQLQLHSKIQKKALSIAKADHLPSLALAGDWQYRGQSSEFGYDADSFASSSSATLQLSIPLFSGFGTRAKVEKAHIEINKTAYMKRKLEESIKLEVKSALLEMEKAAKVIRARKKEVEQARRGVEIVEARYSSGLATQLDVLDSQVSLKRAKLGYMRSVFEYLMAEAFLEKATGRV